MRLFHGILLVSAMSLSACGLKDEAKPAPSGTLSRNLDMMDKDGKRYGTVEMDPVGGGRVVDSEGRMIGRIVPPERN